MKLFTLDERFVVRKAGRLGPADRAGVQRRLTLLLPSGAWVDLVN